MSDPRHIERVVREVPLPLNLIAFPGAPSNRDWANAGAARISYGPFPHRALMKQLEESARAAITSVHG
jgi:2-methylisocitrate lyase-like PEP mutase family enzyme